MVRGVGIHSGVRTVGSSDIRIGVDGRAASGIREDGSITGDGGSAGTGTSSG